MITEARILARWLALAALAATTSVYAVDDDLASLLAEPVYGSTRIAGASKQDQDVVVSRDGIEQFLCKRHRDADAAMCRCPPANITSVN